MREMFERVDDGLIDRVFQPAIDWLGDTLDIDGLRAARICTDISAFAWVVSQAGELGRAAAGGRGAELAASLVLMMLGLSAIMVLRTVFQGSSGKSSRTTAGNPLRAAMHTHRLTSLFWVFGLVVKTASDPAGLAMIALFGVGVFGAAALYAAACSPPTARRRSVEHRHGRLALQGF